MGKEVIIEISEVHWLWDGKALNYGINTGFENIKFPYHLYKNVFSGYRITTTNDTITVAIDNRTQCCEDWGYLSSEDELRRFLYTELRSIHITDTALKSYDLPEEGDGRYLNTMFVTFETDYGPFQLIAYNEHNGYYGHDVIVVSDSKRVEAKAVL